MKHLTLNPMRFILRHFIGFLFTKNKNNKFDYFIKKAHELEIKHGAMKELLELMKIVDEALNKREVSE
jgi:hypothetical protein